MKKKPLHCPSMTFRLFNTLSRKKEEFKPLKEGEVSIYSCGPTVYGEPHIGNLRAFLFSDTLRRAFEFLGFKVTQVINITDVGHLTSDEDAGEDKLEKGARQLFFTCKKCGKESIISIAATEEAFKTGSIRGLSFPCNHCGERNTINSIEGKGDLRRKTVWEIAKEYEEKYFEALDAMNILRPHINPRATEHIAEQVAMIEKLDRNGFVYRTSDGLYFDTSKFPKYGELSGQKLDEKEAGARVELRGEKRNPADFALWKFCIGEHAHHVMRWKNPLGIEGEGFPGWHIECSAMSTKYLGEVFDIHTGGIDHIPVHHENEIAQSEGALGHPFVRYWMHSNFLTVDGGRMGKSLGNGYTVSDLHSKGFDPIAFRLLCLGSHYRSGLNFTWEALENAAISLKRMRMEFQKLPKQEEKLVVDPIAYSQFIEALEDDLNTPKALAVLQSVIKGVGEGHQRANTIAAFDLVLGLRLDQPVGVFPAKEVPNRVEAFAEARLSARQAKNWAESDRLRDEIAKLGWKVEDTKDGFNLTSL